MESKGRKGPGPALPLQMARQAGSRHQNYVTGPGQVLGDPSQGVTLVGSGPGLAPSRMRCGCRCVTNVSAMPRLGLSRQAPPPEPGRTREGRGL